LKNIKVSFYIEKQKRFMLIILDVLDDAELLIEFKAEFDRELVLTWT